MAKKKFKIPGVSFSWKRAAGITKAKSAFARKTGIPTSKQGMKRKAAKMMTGGCLTYAAIALLAVGAIITAVIVML